MEPAPPTGTPGSEDEARALAVQALLRGAERDAVVTELVGRGIERERASELVASIGDELARTRDSEAFDRRSLVPAALVGLVAALVGGALWGVISQKSGYEIGFVAWGIGFLAGWAVVVAARGRKGVPLQAVAVLCAALGFVLGKYVAFALEVDDEVNIGVLSSDTMTLFRENLDIPFSAWDLLWAGLALWTAWRVPRPLLGRTASV